MEKVNVCDCGAELQFDKMLSIIDAYDNKLMVCNRYYCPECEDEYEINEEVEQVTVFVNIHMQAFENWREGKVAKAWHDEDNILCIKYENGNWWHYKLNDDNHLEWW
ncbi:hypothetical protein FDB92_20235 [Clostridium butyricum]|uniref:hypothetical protein n=1 Tax=Clostridium butyricum TaxID=1492 RepID=UPI0013CA98F1|nr:hypothetical protein [Clostridium butyricum]NFL33448.1 hypothetical protein [Clostridium butyricum]